MRPARLGSGAGKALASERLHAHHRADLVAVHIHVAHLHPVTDELRRFVDAAVDPERQAIAGGVYGIANFAEAIRRIAHDVQDRPEHLPLQHADGIDGEYMRWEEHPILQRWID